MHQISKRLHPLHGVPSTRLYRRIPRAATPLPASALRRRLRCGGTRPRRVSDPFRRFSQCGGIQTNCVGTFERSDLKETVVMIEESRPTEDVVRTQGLDENSKYGRSQFDTKAPGRNQANLVGLVPRTEDNFTASIWILRAPEASLPSADSDIPWVTDAS